MKNSVKSSSTLLRKMSFMIIVLIMNLAAFGQQKESNLRLIAPDVVAQGQTFTGTVGEETENGFIPLKKGSQIQVMGTVVEVGDQGKVKIPSCSEASGTFPLLAELISLPERTLPSTTLITSTTPTFIPVSNAATPNIEIWNTSDIVGPGELITVQGTNVDQLSQEVLQSTTGNTVPLTEVSSSYFESQFLVSGNFPEGDYHFSAQDPAGETYISEDISVNPTLEMQGPALKNVGQRGKITLKTNVDGVIILSGGLPIIQFLLNSDVIQPLGNDHYRISVEAGKTIKIPFRAHQVGQYTVTAQVYAEDELPVEFNNGEVATEGMTSETSYDVDTDETTNSSEIEIISENGTPLSNTPVDGVLTHPDGVEYISTTTNESGTLVLNTVVSGNIPSDLISFYPLQVVGHTLANVQEGNAQNCNEEDVEIDEALIEELAKIFEEQQSVWGTYGGICGTGLLEIARSDPEAFANNTDIKQQIRSWLQELLNNEEDDEEDAEFEFDEAMRDIYKANKETWGNYSGICGTGLLQMAQQDPEGYAKFLEYEAQIDAWFNKDEKTTDDFIIDDELRKIYQDNKDMWGNYQGICGYALWEMANLWPEEYKKFLETEERIKKVMNDTSETPEDPDKDEDGIEDGEEAVQEEIQEKVENPDAPEFKDERITRAFESDNVEPYRTITIRLGGVEAGITKVGDYYFITEQKSVSVDPDTKTAVSFFDFTKGRVIEGKDWYAIYLISLTKSPLNLVSRIVESAESLGKDYLDGLMKDMKENDNPAIVIDIPPDVLLLMQFTASFEMVMPQLGDHVRSINEHFEKALEAAERGDWVQAWLELNYAQFDMAMLVLELWPGGGAVKGGKATVKPLVEASTISGKKMDEVIDVLRTAAKNETNADIANAISKKADDLQEIASQSSQVRRAFDIGTPRPTNMATAAKDKKALEEFFGAENVNKLGRKSENNVLVITAKGPDGSDVKQVWVRPGYSDYRKAYSDVHGDIPEGMDIDHLQSETRAAQQGYGYVLIVPVDSSVNRSWGSTIEKGTVQAGNAGHLERILPDMRMIDQFQWWKLQGYTPTRIKEHLMRNIKKASD
ncbi:hypothetical protein POV27_12480 [Aureisphaera galaxeae]|uniref:hypothetical protein n=1 Tax=Aureisphaera galaxeae TaxID=1538023 RepID=UPI00234FF8DB|nr:hypothetical protein [Aureisphaera galaxeae]MDC8004870.1 hypothetical protein [Aureisphaera galaxeae]